MLQRLLALARVSNTKFVSASPGKAPPGAKATFGGTIVAQSLWAALKTTASAFEPSSLQCYFLIGGDPKEGIVYEVELLRDGRNFAHRQVRAYQFEKLIFVATILLHHADPSKPDQQSPSTDGIQYLKRASGFPDLQQMVPASQLFRSEVVGKQDRYHNLNESWSDPRKLDPFIERFETGVIDYRFPHDLFNSSDFHDCGKLSHLSHLDYYQRVRDLASESPEEYDPRFQYVEFAYLSDAYLLLCLPYFHLLPLYCHKFSVSLDHSIYFHKRPNVHDWLAVRVANPRSNKSRHLVQGEYYDTNKDLVASVNQEGLVLYDSPSSIRARF
ncbi:LANO_0E16094g1_1 [Lachancea nothofagi CBS 11611]|uniref:LANO_0E16094g1_1 n=1 Tax=Lachancea nothofagi CBS 11611 TaxID=1266666 RepID=A0A1G4K1M8_9SACH|nr:LANO_0E16094g1_1 [Lachancea nothofagi CBS 11611]